jgi:hypothetical protein
VRPRTLAPAMTSKDMYLKTGGLLLVAAAGVIFLWSLGRQQSSSVSQPALLKAARPQQHGAVIASWLPDGYLRTSSDQAFVSLYEDGANSVQLVIALDQPRASSGVPEEGELTASDDAIAHAARMAHRLGLNLTLSLQIELTDDPGKWRSDIGKTMKPVQRLAWLSAYRDEVLRYASLAERDHASVLVIGSELGALSGESRFWRSTIAAVRKRFHGKLAYAATPLESTRISWWDKLDFVGIDLYPLLSHSRTPSESQLARSWKQVSDELEQIAVAKKRPVLITEVGFPSVDGAAEAPLAADQKARVDVNEQKLIYASMLKTLLPQSWLAGIYLYRWQEPGDGTAGDFTPRGKPAEQVVRQFFHARG